MLLSDLFGAMLNILTTAVALAVVLASIGKMKRGAGKRWLFPVVTGTVFLVFYLLEPSVASYKAFAAWYPDVYSPVDTYNIKDVVRSTAFLLLFGWLGREASRGHS